MPTDVGYKDEKEMQSSTLMEQHIFFRQLRPDHVIQPVIKIYLLDENGQQVK